MGKSYAFQGDDGENYQVTFGLLEAEGSIRPYGIRAEIFRQGEKSEVAEVAERFLTKDEAEQTMDLLCRFRVTPCTLCDII